MSTSSPSDGVVPLALPSTERRDRRSQAFEGCSRQHEDAKSNILVSACPTVGHSEEVMVSWLSTR
jgi:hypothetical protein